ncbi:MAG: hypothetical protein Q8O32_02895, partial [bacterium]|nr:hypothetical protein [bacterium]
SCDNENNVSANYSNFLTTLSGFLLGLSPLIVNPQFIQGNIWFKIFLLISILSIFLSFIFGGVHIFLKKRFFSKWTNGYSKIFENWNNCENECDIDKAKSCESCIFENNSTASPQWTLVVQSILLLFGLLSFIIII